MRYDVYYSTQLSFWFPKNLSTGNDLYWRCTSFEKAFRWGRPLNVLHYSSRHLGSLTAANWVSFDFNVSYSSCWGYSLINTFKLKKNSSFTGANRRGGGGNITQEGVEVPTGGVTDDCDCAFDDCDCAVWARGHRDRWWCRNRSKPTQNMHTHANTYTHIFLLYKYRFFFTRTSSSKSTRTLLLNTHTYIQHAHCLGSKRALCTRICCF